MKKISVDSRLGKIFIAVGFLLMLGAVVNFVLTLKPNVPLWRPFIGFIVLFIYAAIVTPFTDDTWNEDTF